MPMVKVSTRFYGRNDAPIMNKIWEGWMQEGNLSVDWTAYVTAALGELGVIPEFNEWKEVVYFVFPSNEHLCESLLVHHDKALGLGDPIFC